MKAKYILVRLWTTCINLLINPAGGGLHQMQYFRICREDNCQVERHMWLLLWCTSAWERNNDYLSYIFISKSPSLKTAFRFCFSIPITFTVNWCNWWLGYIRSRTSLQRWFALWWLAIFWKLGSLYKINMKALEKPFNSNQILKRRNTGN